ncbi:MAG: glycoside hydrolase family 31 protein [Clostridia bacterium]|nr:glycoside hydrolase family 31 protein [Clostridia bacterium]
MGFFEEKFSVKTDPVANEKSIAVVGSIRVTVLFSKLIRVEKKTGDSFCDMPTQSVWFRNFSAPKFTVNESKNFIIISTEDAEFLIKKSSGKLKSVMLKGGKKITDFKSGNLKGTRRTLDMTYGKIPLDDGIISKNGVAILDDKKSLVINDDGTVSPFERSKDYYVFAYGHDYREALSDFYKITGATPLLPRYALGNWWSRYKAYTQEEYLNLMHKFEDKKIPITVATVDMDWHWVDVVGKFGKDAKNEFRNLRPSEIIQSDGWTGYSWNTDLFPNYKEFLQKLKEMNLHTTLNVHPSMGVRWFEDQYKEFAEFLGLDPQEKKQIPFDMTDKFFVEAYFKFLHHKYENEGVDFWWIDWQQGSKTKIPGLDPLWALNHYHFMDSDKNNKRPLILSRFAGAGSHRYPLGFSGDTAIYWSVLKFQPYFTATASNIGYSWWSHDIGGHRGGKKDDELYLRWVQLGVFSPVNRLHSSNNELMGKEPWKHSKQIEIYAEEALRLRHRLLPYIYTMNYRCHKFGAPLIEPMYYSFPEENEAYECDNQFFFGSEMIVAPITKKCDKHTLTSFADVWLPDGKFTDIFTNKTYIGGEKIRMFRGLDSIPVLAKEGAIIPLSANGESNEISLPKEMEILVFNGNNSFKMYEDDGETNGYLNGEFSFTTFTVSDNGKDLTFTISIEDNKKILPYRNYILSFRNIKSFSKIETENAFVNVMNDSEFVRLSAQKNNAENVMKITIKDYKFVDETNKADEYINTASRYNSLNLTRNFYAKTAAKGEGGILTPRKLKEQYEEISKMR